MAAVSLVGDWRDRVDLRALNRCVLEAANAATARALHGQVVDLTIDTEWLYSARDSEITAELREVLVDIRARAVPADIAAGPQSPPSRN